MTNALIQVEQLTRKYEMEQTEVWALRGINLEIRQGDFTALCGRSGSGKTTLLNIIGCLDRATSGSLAIEGQLIHRLSDDEKSRFRAERLGFIFQNFNLLPVLSAVENVEYPLLNLKYSRRERRMRAEQALESVGLGRHLNHRPAELSGGQRQRVAIARAIVHQPSLIIADEPTANLDRRTAQEILRLLGELNVELGVTCLIATHDPMVMATAKNSIHIGDGVVEEAAPSNVTSFSRVRAV